MSPRHASVTWAVLATAMLGVPAAFAAEAPKASEAKMPKARAYSYIYDMLDNSVSRPITRTLDLPIGLRKLTGNHREAANIDSTDQVLMPSTWWQPRIGFRPVTVYQMLHGPGTTRGPAPGRWTITKGKTQGVTPGFQIKDSKGDRFFIKFDSPTSPELGTSADVVGSMLFWAAGYNVPENHIAFFRPDSLDIDAKATYKTASGREQPFTKVQLGEILGRVHRRRDGQYRVVASRFLPGKPLGAFEFNGRRKDDPEDLIPHEHRRELRGLWALCAWLNHADSRGPNSLDVWVDDGGREFVRHYLLDFSAILGAGMFGPRAYPTGTEYYIDAGVGLKQLGTLGLRSFDWEDAVDPRIPSVGFIEAAEFNPRGWRPDYPNPAFDERTVRDIRWGARIVAGFTDAHIRAAVEAGGYTSPMAMNYLTRVLIERRDKIVKAWLGPDSGADGKGRKP